MQNGLNKSLLLPSNVFFFFVLNDNFHLFFFSSIPDFGKLCKNKKKIILNKKNFVI